MSKSTKVIAGLGVVAALGVAALPVASFAVTTGDVPLSITVQSKLGLAVQTTTAPVHKTDPGKAIATAASTLTATSNDVHGYTITATGTADTNGLTLKGADGNSYTIAPISEADGVAITNGADISEAGSSWGIKLGAAYGTGESGDFAADVYKGVTDGATVVKSTSSVYPESPVTTVNYGFIIGDDAPVDTYTGSITYTIAANPAPTTQNGD